MPMKYSVGICKFAWLIALFSVLTWTEAAFAACNIVTNGLVGCYSFDANNAQDGSGNGNHGTAAAGVSYVAGKVGQAAKFTNSATGYIRVPNPTQRFEREYSISAWVSTTGNGGTIFSKYLSQSGGHNGFGLFVTTPNGDGSVNSGSTLFADTLFYEGWNPAKYPSYTLPLNLLHLVTVVYNVGNTKIYIDGQLTVEKTIQHSASLNNPYDILIGSYLYNNGAAVLPVYSGYSGRSFSGLIDELRIYNRALTQAEITQLLNEGNAPCVPATYNGNTGALQVPFISVEGISTAYRTTFLQFASSFAFRINQNAVNSGSNSCPASYSTSTGVLHIPIVKTTVTLVPSVSQCYDVTMQAFSSRFQLDLENLKVIPCP